MSKVAKSIRRGLEETLAYARGEADKRRYRVHVPRDLDVRAYDAAKRRLASGEDELVPAAIAHRLLDGENPVRVWREHRGMSARALAERAGISAAYLSQIEAGRRDGSFDTMRKIASALGVALDDLVATAIRGRPRRRRP